MKPDDEYRMSFYSECGDLNSDHNIRLVKHIETGKIYVRKELSEYDLNVFMMLKSHKYEGIPEIIDFAEDDESGRLIVIEEFINGMTLRHILDKKGTLPEDQAISVLKAVCDTLSPLHNNTPPVIHRDIKPENILITNDSELYLIDFDASRVYEEGQTRDTELIGTRKYAAPEQYGYNQSDPRTDVYAIGKVGREMITGDPSGKSGHISAVLSDILNRCTAMDPEDRFNSADDLKKALTMIDKPYFFRKYSKYALPGFRTHTPWKMVLGLSIMLCIIGYAVTMTPVESLSFRVNILRRICGTMMLILMYLLYGNYLECHSWLPLINSKTIWIKAGGFILYTTLIIYSLRIIFAFFGYPVGAD